MAPDDLLHRVPGRPPPPISRGVAPHRLLLAASLTLAACAPAGRDGGFGSADPAPSDPAIEVDGPVDPADAIDEATGCADPWTDGPRVREEAAARGLTEPLFSVLLDTDLTDASDGGGSEVVAQDLDGDGDVDLLFNRLDVGPTLYANDGTGHFESRGEPLDVSFVQNPSGLPEAASWVRVAALSAVDLDGDGLPELVTAGFGHAEVWPNQGDLDWGAPIPLPVDSPPGTVITTAAFGDLDGDGRLDVVLPHQLLGAHPTPDVSHAVLLQRADDRFEHALDLRVEPGGSDSIATTLTDFDRDGDLDVLLLKDQGDHSGLLRNDGVGADGLPIFTDVAAALGFDIDWNAMGMDSADLNDDGMLDWCVTDNGPPVCLLSSDSGYIHASAALGTLPSQPVGALGSLGWSLELADLDNDGHVELIQASGRTDWRSERYPDLLLRGLPGGRFEDVSAAWGVDSTDDHYAAAAADFDNDGFLDLVMTGPGLVPQLFMTRCGSESWLDFDLAGPPGNGEGFGAIVEVLLPDRTLTRELYSQRAQGQGPSRLHFGLGDVATDVPVSVLWPDGVRQDVGPLAPGRRVQLRHPDTHVPPPPNGDGG